MAELQSIFLDVWHHDQRTPRIEQRSLDHVIIVNSVRLGLHEHAEIETPGECRQDSRCGRPYRREQAMLCGNQAAPGGGFETFYRCQSGLLALGDHPGHEIGWNFRHHIARKIRCIGNSNCGEMRIEGLGDRDGEVASRIARCLVLQMDDNVLDHRNTPVGDVRPSEKALSDSGLS
jgi:hypothetical protein